MQTFVFVFTVEQNLQVLFSMLTFALNVKRKQLNSYWGCINMPRVGQRTYTMTGNIINVIQIIAEKNFCSASHVIRLCILSHFGDKEQKKNATEILRRFIHA